MKEKTKRIQAVALAYDAQNDAAPKVVAKGKGFVAANMIEKAKEHHVPIQEDTSLVELLSEIQINKTIPEQLYGAVAEVFAFIYHVDRQYSKK
ncbi:EscU/YscU/HrcU family type III secretion system export apparatus switch protein [Bacillus sp. BRMEA1]|uniref:EscU/YscU/HrcU family type III secretion system export apparatus switch protein n=1 Tax=Neobacillus endophyticus TaxID=2738405 RepID=UPI0015674EF7|nr:EscU/YscU/HrcU family type III secretion system export apparatus switch protein [Neobacillus endophyticus]NRD80091.1 EscU/YscU/HrcU family type III secretion system export apparatus switch protein [Neobacillus endophyticus]